MGRKITQARNATAPAMAPGMFTPTPYAKDGEGAACEGDSPYELRREHLFDEKPTARRESISCSRPRDTSS